MLNARSLRISFCTAAALVVGCGAKPETSTLQATPVAEGPTSIHGLPLPLTERVGVVLEITSGSFGIPQAARTAADEFSTELRNRNNAISDAGGRLLFVAASIDASAAVSGSAAARQIAEQDATQVSRAMQEYGLDQQTVRSQVVLFFNDSSQEMKQIYGNATDNPTVAVVNLDGDIVDVYRLPTQKAAALAALDQAQAEGR